MRHLRLTLPAVVAGLALSACASLPPPPPPPAGETMLGSRADTGARSGARAAPPSRTRLDKRQYLDERSGRYYYFDKTRQAYFWEDGTPKR